MDGLRELRAVAENGTLGKGPHWFKFETPSPSNFYHPVQVPVFPSAIAQIWPKIHGSGAGFRFSKNITANLLAKFVERGYSSSELIPPDSEPSQLTHTAVKLVFIQTDRDREDAKEKIISGMGSQIVNIARLHFEDVWRALNPHPRLGKMMSYGMLRGFEFLGRTADNEGVSGHLATRSIRFMWTIRQHEQSSDFDARCIILSDLSEFHPDSDPAVKRERDWAFLEKKIRWKNRTSDQSPVTVALNHFEAFKEDSDSPLYLPFAISVYALEECRERLGLVNERVMTWVSRDKLGEHAEGTFEQNLEKHEVNRIFMVEFTQQDIPMELESTRMVLNTTESLWGHLAIMAKELPDTAKSEHVDRSTESILTALCQLRQELEGLREVLTFIEMRMNSYLSMVSFSPLEKVHHNSSLGRS